MTEKLNELAAIAEKELDNVTGYQGIQNHVSIYGYVSQYPEKVVAILHYLSITHGNGVKE